MMDCFEPLLTVMLFLTVFGTSFTFSSNTIYLERGYQNVVKCNGTSKMDRCSWMKDSEDVISTDRPVISGYSIDRRRLPNGACDLKINTVRSNDTGTWICFIIRAKQQVFNVRAGVRPTKNYFVYDKDEITPNEYKKTRVTPDATSGEVQVKCVSWHVYPAPVITWEVGHDIRRDAIQKDIVNTDDNTVTSTSTIVLRYPRMNESGLKDDRDSKWEKRVSCLIHHDGYKTKEERIRAIFVQPHPIRRVNLIQINKGNVSLLICSSNGFPDPVYEIQRIKETTKMSIGKPFLVNRQTVGQSGLYVCKASNFIGKRLFSMAKSKEVVVEIKPGQPNDNSNNSERLPRLTPMSLSAVAVVTIGLTRILSTFL